MLESWNDRVQVGKCTCGGMAYAADLDSVPLMGLLVRLQPSAPSVKGFARKTPLFSDNLPNLIPERVFWEMKFSQGARCDCKSRVRK